MKRIIFAFLIFCLMLSPTYYSQADVITEEYICIANYSYLYLAPSFTSEKIKIDEKEIVVSHKNLIKICCSGGAPISEQDEQGKVFYKVYSFDGNTFDEAYIFSGSITKNEINIQQYPTFNASTNTDTILYMLSDGQYVPTETKIERGTRIYLYEGWNNNETYIAVSVKIGNQIEYGYILKSDIAPDGINPAIIYSITIALACIGIILALVFMKNKKRKK